MRPSATRHAATPSPIDFPFLAEQTAGDGALEAELLALFDRQARDTVERVAAPSPDGACSPQDRLLLLHTLCGAARAVGAWEVASDAQRLEEDARTGKPPTPPDALRASVARACALIAGLPT